jgi:hypothetical protein
MQQEKPEVSPAKNKKKQVSRGAPPNMDFTSLQMRKLTLTWKKKIVHETPSKKKKKDTNAEK